MKYKTKNDVVVANVISDFSFISSTYHSFTFSYVAKCHRNKVEMTI